MDTSTETAALATTDSAGQLVQLEGLPADRHPAAVYLAGLGAGSQRSQRSALDTIAGMLTSGRMDAQQLPWGQLRYQHVQAVRAQLAERFAPATANRHLSALRGALREAWRLGYMDAEAFHRAADVKPVRGTTVPAGREVTSNEAQRFLEGCSADDTAAGVRDAALFALLYGAGLRRAEAVALDVGSYDTASAALTVRGKGNKARVVYATNGGRAALEDWLAARGSDAGPLFLPVNKGGRIIAGQRMTAQAAYQALRRRSVAAGLQPFAPHDLRRTFAGDMLDAGADLAVVQQLMGHANPATTSRYDRRGERAKVRASQLRHVPYVGRARG